MTRNFIRISGFGQGFQGRAQGVFRSIMAPRYGVNRASIYLPTLVLCGTHDWTQGSMIFSSSPLELRCLATATSEEKGWGGYI